MHTDMHDYIRGDLVTSCTPSDVIEKYKEQRRRFIKYRKMGAYRIHRDFDMANEWWFIPNPRIELCALDYIRDTYHYHEVYDKDTSNEWRDYRNEPVVIVRCINYKNKADFQKRLLSWVCNDTVTDTKNKRTISTENVKFIVMTDYTLPLEVQEYFKLGNLKTFI